MQSMPARTWAWAIWRRGRRGGRTIRVLSRGIIAKALTKKMYPISGLKAVRLMARSIMKSMPHRSTYLCAPPRRSIEPGLTVLLFRIELYRQSSSSTRCLMNTPVSTMTLRQRTRWSFLSLPHRSAGMAILQPTRMTFCPTVATLPGNSRSAVLGREEKRRGRLGCHAGNSRTGCQRLARPNLAGPPRIYDKASHQR